MEIEGITALVTGSNRGIGRAIARELGERGAEVLGGVRQVDGDHSLEGVPNVRPVRIDLSSPDSVEAGVRELGADASRIDLLVNNAGVFSGGLFDRTDVETAYELLQVNLAAPMHLTRLLLPGMLERRRGKIVNNASIIGHTPFPGAVAYAASKTGLHGFTESLRRELDETDVTVLELITPGVDTDMMDQVQRELDSHAETGGWDHVDPEDWAEKVADAIKDDDDELNPGGGERLAKLLPKALLDLGAKRAFSR